MILFHHKTKQHEPKFPKVYMKATVNKLFMSICVNDVNYIETQSNHLKFLFFIFISSWKIVESTIEVTCKENQWWHVLYSCSMTPLMSNSKLCRVITLRKVINPPEKFVQGSFSAKLAKVFHKVGIQVWPRVLFNRSFTLIKFLYWGLVSTQFTNKAIKINLSF